MKNCVAVGAVTKTAGVLIWSLKSTAC